jgi:hypothetical protein
MFGMKRIYALTVSTMLVYITYAVYSRSDRVCHIRLYQVSLPLILIAAVPARAGGRGPESRGKF